MFNNHMELINRINDEDALLTPQRLKKQWLMSKLNEHIPVIEGSGNTGFRYVYNYLELICQELKESQKDIYDALVHVSGSPTVMHMLAKHRSEFKKIATPGWEVSTYDNAVLSAGTGNPQREYQWYHSTVRMGVQFETWKRMKKLVKKGDIDKIPEKDILRWIYTGSNSHPTIRLVKYVAEDGNQYFSISDGFQRTMAYLMVVGMYRFENGESWKDILTEIPIKGTCQVSESWEDCREKTLEDFSMQGLTNQLSDKCIWEGWNTTISGENQARYQIMVDVFNSAGIEVADEADLDRYRKAKVVKPTNHYKKVFKTYINNTEMLVNAYSIAKNSYTRYELTDNEVRSVIHLMYLFARRIMKNAKIETLINHPKWNNIRELMIECVSAFNNVSSSQHSAATRYWDDYCTNDSGDKRDTKMQAFDIVPNFALQLMTYVDIELVKEFSYTNNVDEDSLAEWYITNGKYEKSSIETDVHDTAEATQKLESLKEQILGAGYVPMMSNIIKMTFDDQVIPVSKGSAAHRNLENAGWKEAS